MASHVKPGGLQEKMLGCRTDKRQRLLGESRIIFRCRSRSRDRSRNRIRRKQEQE